MFIVDLAANFRKVREGSPGHLWPSRLQVIELNSIASTVRSAEEEILNEWIARLLKLTRRSVKINPAFVQIGNAVGYIKCAFHIVCNHHAGHSKALLQPANQSIDAIRDYRIKTGCWLIVQYTRGAPNDGARQPDPFFHPAAPTFPHLIFLTFHFHHVKHL